MRKFAGITIGPIGETIGEASSPAALWFASSLFSDLTRRICEAIKGPEGFAQVSIYSPFYDEAIRLDDGIGKFHDRIIFSATDLEAQKLKEILHKVKRATVEIFPKEVQKEGTADFLEEYLQVHFVIKTEEELAGQNSILSLSGYLDALELMKSFPGDDAASPIRELYLGEENDGNKYIKKSPLFERIQKSENQLKKSGGGIWKIDEIASCRGRLPEDYKYRYYYAVVSADGDGMGKFLNQLSDDKVTEFSKACLSYDEKAAALVGAFGGMTIYAGGDDLLFLAPVRNEKGEYIFDLCAQINTLFQNEIRSVGLFKDITCIPTISFGISIQYDKSPLYEALSTASSLLYRAKGDEKKNCMVVKLQKHSGQSLSLLLGNEDCTLLEKILSAGKDKKEEEVLSSILFTLERNKALILVLNEKAAAGAIDKTTYTEAWTHFFDNAGQKKAEDYVTEICEIYYDGLVTGCDRALVTEHRKDADASLQTLLNMLRFKKFMKEKGGREE